MAYSEKHKLYMRAWKEKNRDKINARNRAAYAANPERTTEKNNAWKEKNRAKYLERRREEHQRLKAAGKLNTPAQRAYKRAWAAANRERIRERARLLYRTNDSYKIANLIKATRRRRAQCEWADEKKIWLIYAEARRKTRETGIKHVVDHIVPLKHSLVSGLHNEHNLRVITQSENAKKKNHFEVRA